MDTCEGRGFAFSDVRVVSSTAVRSEKLKQRVVSRDTGLSCQRVASKVETLKTCKKVPIVPKGTDVPTERVSKDTDIPTVVVSKDTDVPMKRVAEA